MSVDETLITGRDVLVEPAGGENGARPSREYTLSIDTGGTFTDGFVSDGVRFAQVKVDTTPHDLTVGFGECVAAAAEAVGEPLPSFLATTRLIHFSSTIATNTVVERSGPRVGLVVTAGAETNLYGDAQRAAHLREFVDADLVRGVEERVDESGRVELEPSGAQVEEAVRHLLERGIRMLLISFANAHLNPANERRAREIIDRSYPRHYLGAVPLLLSSQVSLAPENYGRTAAAMINAYLHPNLVRNLYRAEDQTRAAGFLHPLLIVNTDGSSTRVAKTRALDTYNSGPSAGVLGSGYVARELGAKHVCTFDVGGTTTDVSYLMDGVPPRMSDTEVGEMRVPHPSIDLFSFGLGGGSIISVDDDLRFRVGPESSGSAPGPASFGLGGEDATPTDVWVALGYLQPGEFLSGRRRLDRGLAERAIRRIAEKLGTDVEEAALRAKEAVAVELGAHLTRWRKRHPDLTSDAFQDGGWLFSYGGGGGLLCIDAAEALGIDRVVVFPHSSVFSAFGGGLLPISHTYQAAVPTGRDRAAVGTAVGRLAEAARRDLRAEGVTDLGSVSASLTLTAFTGGAEAKVDGLTLGELGAQPSDLAAADLDRLGEGVLRCALVVTAERTVTLDVKKGAQPPKDSQREVLTRQGRLRAPILGGLGVADAEPAKGPAFLEAPDTTIFVPDGWTATFDERGYGIVTKEG